jgi:predicted secreted Zn-dependent protease
MPSRYAVQCARCALVTLLLFGLTATAEVSELIDYTYYELPESGAGQPLKEQLDAATPIERNGRKLHADTRWRLDWRFNTEPQTDGPCTITDIDINLDALIRLPELSYTDAELQGEFNRYVEALQRHQIAHYIIAIQAANKINVRFTYGDFPRECKQARAKAEALAAAIEQEHRAQEIALDAQTRYGAEQGAPLPRPASKPQATQAPRQAR